MTQALIGLVGDVLVNRDHPHEPFTGVRDVLKAPDVLFANLESAYTDDPQPVPGALGGCSAPASNLDVFADVGFDVMSMANNHILDVGYKAMLETRARLRARGIRTCGAGDSLSDAREPALVDAGGLRIAFLAYASVFPLGYEARSDCPGIAPLRAHNLWRDPYPLFHVPGKHPLVSTIPDETDTSNLKEDIGKARRCADIVVASFHWGEYTRPFYLTDHERRTARFCIDQGADLVVGHHHHTLRGMEWYRGKPIMYGLGHFVFDLRLPWSEEEYKKLLADIDPAGFFQTPYVTAPRKGWPFLPMHEDTRMTAMAWATADKGGIGAIGFLPCRLSADGWVHPLPLKSPESDEVIKYLEECNRTQRLEGRIVSEGAISIAGLPTMRVVPE